MGYWICEIYERRPKACREYPQSGHWMPESCGYYFENGERKGDCAPECQSTCCMQPRVDGEPGGAALPEIAGGMPCKHLTYVDRHPRSSRSVPGHGEEDTKRGGDTGSTPAEHKAD